MSAPARCLVCEATIDVAAAEPSGWQRGACTCAVDPCPTGAVWLCPEHRVENDAQEAA